MQPVKKRFLRGWPWPAGRTLHLLIVAIVMCNQAQAYRSLNDNDEPELTGATREQQEVPAGKPRKYLYPMLIFGPNNQITGFKEVLALGRLMDRTTVVHDIKVSHPLDASSQEDVTNIKDFLDFDMMYDYAHTASRRHVVTLAERLAAGWSGKLDAVVYYTSHWLPYWQENLSQNVSVDNTTTWLNYGVELTDCSEAGIANLTKLIEPYDTVGFIMFKNAVWDAGYGIIQTGRGLPNRCLDEYLQVNADLKKSAKMKAIARAFIETRIIGDDTNSNQRYMAVHIRPYPDTCMALWRRRRSLGGTLPSEEADKDCHNPSLMRIFVNQTLAAVRRYNVSSNVFVMCHPAIRTIITTLYNRAGMQPLFYNDFNGLVREFGFSCPSLLGMIEQEIANQADVFLGTKSSSMSGIVVEERSTAIKNLSEPRQQVTTFFVGDNEKLQRRAAGAVSF